ncbi:MAG: three-Cys-motif partner protein TcmP, partial [Chloroflexia bacterium]|nr:three-Cys-motif partner protein TcmP [Chloroflexia bacterium]
MGNSEFYNTPEQQSILKTKLVAKYFGAWSQIMLAQSSGPIAYIDLFAGPGKFDDGLASTPLWILNHAIRDDKLCSRLITVFNDKEAKYVAQLQAEIDVLPGIEKLAYRPCVSNAAVGNELVDILREKSLLPTLFFIDPWGYKGLSLDLIGHGIKSWGCDCIFFFNYNRINPGINNRYVVERMNDIFGSVRAEQLREKVQGLSPEERQVTIINVLSDGASGKRVVAWRLARGGPRAAAPDPAP